MEKYSTVQENFWAGAFGNEYTERNNDEKMIASNIALFSKVLSRTNGINSCIELGSNRGLNLLAMNRLIPGLKIQAVEINKNAAAECDKISNVSVFHGSVFDYSYSENVFDLSFTKGVLIHIAPEMLGEIYDVLYHVSRKYVLVAEYYNPAPVEVTYRGNEGKLFKRDFAGELMERFSDLILIDYGFVYHKDYNFACDDITWFLMEKRCGNNRLLS